MITFIRSYVKSMRLYYSFVTGMAGWLGVAYYEYLEKPGQTWLCEAYASAIRDLAGKSAILPLDPEKSKIIHQTWDRGKPTELYKVLEEK